MSLVNETKDSPLTLSLEDSTRFPARRFEIKIVQGPSIFQVLMLQSDTLDLSFF